MMTAGAGLVLCVLACPARADFLPGSYTYKLVLRDDQGFALSGTTTSEKGDERVSANYTIEVYNAEGDKLNATVADATVDGDTGCNCSVTVPVGSGAGYAKVGERLTLVVSDTTFGNERFRSSKVLPPPYTIGSTQLDDDFWISSFSGLDGTSDSVATIRRHSTLRTGPDFKSTRLVGRSVWNDRWLLVVPASSLNANRAAALEKFVNGIDDIKIGVRAYSRQGN